ncbi:MAG: hypothetical protein ACIALR_16885 [Blastopirellula sp. JB062]
MLGPQFTIRRLLLATALLAIVCWTLASAVQGHLWAIAAMVTLASGIVWLVGQILLLAFAAAASWAFGSARRKTLDSPFATDTPAPQILPTQSHVAE